MVPSGGNFQEKGELFLVEIRCKLMADCNLPLSFESKLEVSFQIRQRLLKIHPAFPCDSNKVKNLDSYGIFDVVSDYLHLGLLLIHF
jgi:hypothetical protein